MQSMWREWAQWAAALLLLHGVCLAQKPEDKPAQLEITTKVLPEATVGRAYKAEMEVAGGKPPLVWRVRDGRLPPGLQLNETRGVITGTPEAAGRFEFTVVVRDASPTPHSSAHRFALQVTAALTLIWKTPPRAVPGGIEGSVEISNYSADEFDLTVIIVAVNENRRATALGYQRMILRASVVNRVITFKETLPQGKYVVHADAVAEIAAKNRIYRARLQTPGTIGVVAPF